MERLKVRRAWMYKNVGHRGTIPFQFLRGLTEFMLVASSNGTNMTEIRCPCKKCKATKHHPYEIVQRHLTKNGFMDDYYVWIHHGEDAMNVINMSVVVEDDNVNIDVDFDESTSTENRMTEMVIDAAGPSMLPNSLDVEEEPNPKANFFLTC
jgi:hypothetical protein